MTFSVYSLNKLTDIDEDAINMPERLDFLKGRKNIILTYSVASYLLCLLLTYPDGPASTAIALVPLAIGVLYGSSIFGCIPRLKDIPVMKNVTVAASLALTTTLLPAIHVIGKMMPIATVMYFVLVKVFVNTVIYDLRDVEGDEENGVRTLPIILGRKKTVLMLLTLNSTLLPSLMFLGKNALPLAGTLILWGYAYIIYFKERKDTLTYDFLLDGEWVLMNALNILFQVCLN